MEFENSIIGKTIDQRAKRGHPQFHSRRMLWKFDNIKKSEQFLQLEQQRRGRKQDEQGQPYILKEQLLAPIEALRVSFEIQEDVASIVRTCKCSFASMTVTITQFNVTFFERILFPAP